MNKLVKGSIAGAVGVALLLGGGSTFALWNDAAGVAGGTVSSGTLDIVSTGNASWTDVSPELLTANPTGVPITTIGSYKIVPGDVLELKQQVTIKATGTNLLGELTYDAASVDIDAALLPYVDFDFEATAATTPVGDASVTAGAANVYTVDPSATGGTTVVNVVITVTFDDATDEQNGQTISNGIDLTDLSFTLTQVRP